MVSVTIGKHIEYPETCPFQHESHTGVICCHPTIDTTMSHLYCGYYNSPHRYVDSPYRCPLVKNPVKGVKIQAVLK